MLKEFDLMNDLGKGHGNKLELDGVRVESVDDFELFYDRKMEFSVKYEGLITVMEYIREHCWVK